MKCLKLKLPAIMMMLILMVSGGCRSSRHHSGGMTVSALEVKSLKGVRKKIVEESMDWMGTPYKYAGTQKGKGADCSGMVMKVYEKAAGLALPRNSGKQSEFCRRLKERNVRPGDLVFFATGKDGKTVSHVGIMVDDTRFIHASTKKGVILSDMTTPYYRRTFIMYGRVPGISD